MRKETYEIRMETLARESKNWKERKFKERQNGIREMGGDRNESYKCISLANIGRIMSWLRERTYLIHSWLTAGHV